MFVKTGKKIKARERGEENSFQVGQTRDLFVSPLRQEREKKIPTKQLENFFFFSCLREERKELL